MADEIHIAFGVDRKYLNQVAVAIASIVANASTPEALRFYIVHDEDETWVSEQIATWSVPRPQAVKMRNPFDEYRGEPGSFWTTAMLFRVLLPSALPQLGRVIYLDADITVTRDVAELWRTDLGTASAAGVIDMGVAIVLSHGEVYRSFTMRDHVLSLGLDPARPTYVNSGLLLLDLDKLREQQFVRAALEMDISRRNELIYLDQDIINAVLRGRVVLLDPRWNVHAQVMSRRDSRRHHYLMDSLQPDLALQKSEQWAIHYTGPNKPWNSAVVWQGEVWWRYAALSGLDWPRPAVAKRSLAGDLREGLLDTISRMSALRHKWRRYRSKAAVREASGARSRNAAGDPES